MHLAETKFKTLIDRIDANFYVSRLGAIEELHRQYKNLGDLCNFPRAKTPPRELYFNTGVPVIKLKNVSNYFLQLKDTDFIPQSNYQEFVQPKIGDILITATGEGTIGRVGIFENGVKCVVTAEVMLVRSENINSYFLLAYLRSPHGRYQLERFARGSTGQTHLYSKDVALIPVPQVSEKIQMEVEKLVKQAHQKKKSADEKYEEAEKGLYELLRQEKLDLKFEKTFEAGAGEVFSAMRFDSEYYQPKYKEIIKILNKSGLKIKYLKDCVWQKNRRANPTKEPSDKFIYIEIGDINVASGEINDKEIYGHEAPPNARKKLKAGDIVISRVRPTRGAITLISEELDNAIGSSAFYVCQPQDEFIPEFLFLYLRSELSLNQLGRPIVGSMYPTIKDENVESLLVPVISKPKQEKITELVRQSFALQKKAKQLLDEATKRVEVAT